MKKYKHWLKVDGYSFDTERQYNEIEKYLQNYPESNIKVYQYTYDLFNKVVLLECNQSYNDLGMIVNSGSNNLRRLSQKPRNITEMKDIIIKNGRLEKLEPHIGSSDKISKEIINISPIHKKEV